MTCPNCQIELKCPCSNCSGYRLKNGRVEALLWEWVDGETMRCPVCGFTHLADFWEDYDFYLYDKERGKLSDRQEEFITSNIENWRENNR
jgi:hypothetical protein